MTTDESLCELSRKYRVCWETRPEYVIRNGKQQQVGFELELSGTHVPGVEHPTPGCRHCQEVFHALIDIAEQSLPTEIRSTKYELQPYEARILYAQARDYRPDVTLKVKILHRDGSLNPVDRCEERCLAEIEHHLQELGACRRLWTPHEGESRR
jgi:hypothetical protein